MVVITVNPLNTKTLSMPFTLILANLVFLTRVDIGIIVENGRLYIMGKHPLHDGG
jgi:hypothetical protein